MILLSFDIEEFDMPLEYGVNIDFEEQLEVSTKGTQSILALLAANQIKATFYCTAQFAIHRTELIRKIVADGHELASHGYFHSSFEIEHLALSKLKLEELGQTSVQGYRMARMMPVSESEVAKAGYLYNSSINPTYLPGRYNKLNENRTYFKREGVWQLPASVCPLVRFPLFWLTFHNFNLSLYQELAKWTYQTDQYLNVYFHPWEFEDIGPHSRYHFPWYVTRNTGSAMIERLSRFIIWAKHKGYPFGRTIDFIQTLNL